MSVARVVILGWWFMLCLPAEWGGASATAQTTIRFGTTDESSTTLPAKLMLVPIGYQPTVVTFGSGGAGGSAVFVDAAGEFVWDDEESTPARDRFPVFRGSFTAGGMYPEVVLMPDQPFDARVDRWNQGSSGNDFNLSNVSRAWVRIEWQGAAPEISWDDALKHTSNAYSVNGLPFTWFIQHAYKVTGGGTEWSRGAYHVPVWHNDASHNDFVWNAGAGEWRWTALGDRRHGITRFSAAGSPQVVYVGTRNPAWMEWVVYALREDDGAHRDGGTGGDGYERWDDLMDLLNESMPGMGTSLAAIRWNLEHEDVGIASNFASWRTEYTDFRTWFQMTFQLTLFQHLTTIATRVLQLQNALNSTDGISAEQWQWENPDHEEWIAEAFSEVDRPFGGPEDMEAAVTALGSDEVSAPSWSWSLDLGTLLAPFPVPAPIQYVEFSPNLYYVSEYRPILHAIMIALLSLWGVGRVWDELRRY